jgi:hypothetical protein
MYLDAIANNEAQIAKEKKFTSCIDANGVIINTKIRAVIYTDSTFAGTLNPQANRIFAIRQIVVIKKAENNRAIGLYDSNPKKLRIVAITINPIKM